MSVEVQIIAPVITLVFWSMIIWAWMYATRIPAIMKLKLKLKSDVPSAEQMAKLPANVRWKSDNYNHLMEQPTIFYALALSLALLEAGDGINLYLAWVYVGLRIIHSLIQVLGNKILFRFSVFVLSNIPLFWLAINAANTVIQ